MIKKAILWSLATILLVVVLGYGYLYSNGLVPRYTYEDMPPATPVFTKPAVLIFNKTNGFIHHDALPAGNKMLTDLAEDLGWEVFVTDNGAIHNQQDLNKFQLVIWNNVSGDVLRDVQRADFKAWIENGGGWIGIHASGGDMKYDWKWYVDELVGAQFIGHTMDPQFQDADLYAVQKDEALTAHLPGPWRVAQEEWYAFDQTPRNKGYEVLVTIDEASYITVGNTKYDFVDSMEGEHPMVWRHAQGEGRAFYSAIGHAAPTYLVPDYRTLIQKAMVWAADQ